MLHTRANERVKQYAKITNSSKGIGTFSLADKYAKIDPRPTKRAKKNTKFNTIVSTNTFLIINHGCMSSDFRCIYGQSGRISKLFSTITYWQHLRIIFMFATSDGEKIFSKYKIVESCKPTVKMP